MKKRNLLIFVLPRLFLAVLLIYLIFPVYWMIVTAFKDNDVIFRIPPEWIPSHPVVAHFTKLFSEPFFVTYYKNSFIVATGATVMCMFVALFAGYGFSRFRFAGKDTLLLGILSTQMFPVVSLLISLYTMYKSYHLLNNRLGLVLAMTTASLPFCIWMIKGFFDDIPLALDEAARIDGCGRFGVLFRVIFPLSKPGFLSVGIYTFLLSWDDLLYSLTLVNKDELRTLPPGISIRYMGELSYDWGNIMTVCVAATLPVLILFIFLQKYMVSGLTAGSVKG